MNAGNKGHSSSGIDPRTEALLRLQASRERIQRSMRPDHEGPIWHWLEHPFRFLRRWWRRLVPALMAGGWLHAAAGADAAASHGPGTSGAPGTRGAVDTASLHEAGQAALRSARGWVREHPVASVGIAAALGALLIGKRGVLWGLVAGVGQGLMRQGQGWLMRRISDPAIYLAIIAALAAKPAAAPAAPAAPPDRADEGEDEAPGGYGGA